MVLLRQPFLYYGDAIATLFLDSGAVSKPCFWTTVYASFEKKFWTIVLLLQHFP
jgi:hypothetical protein